MPVSNPSHLLALGMILGVMACTEPVEMICTGTIINGECTPGSGPPQMPDSQSSNLDIIPISWDHSPSDDDIDDEAVDWSLCPSVLRAQKPIGAGCELDCECETGFCYDEEYLGDFRFCTRRCNSGCNTGIEGGPMYTCLLFGGLLAEEHDLKITDVCQRICSSLDDCKALSSSYDACGSSKPGTVWGDARISLARTCVITTALE
jgi:hypothetical protein